MRGSRRKTEVEAFEVPPIVRRHAGGIKIGDELEVKVSGGIITMLPKPPTTDDEYTPAQRRMIDAQLDEAEKGPFYGPFETHKAMSKSLHSEVKKAKTKKFSQAKLP
ncbi:MAG: hypothetical protein JJE04_19295 [Acidobacteriia bacterium]|nr:hypothetical protein [Terriglobia bacterium]